MEKNKKTKKILEKTERDQKEVEIVEELMRDFRKRQSERKPFESQWQLNMNFVMGNQYCSVTESGDVEEYTKQFFWQEREVFNHIAPIVEMRLSKLARVRPKMAVVPASSDESDVKTGKVSKKILDHIHSSKDLSSLVAEATKWSEICGTVFYKVLWSKNLGKEIAKDKFGLQIRGGDVDISICPPFEIFPESSTIDGLENSTSLIHARAYPISQIKDIWGVEVDGQNLNVFSLDNSQTLGGLGYSGTAKKITDTTREDYALVLEKYVRPTKDLPNGRLTIVAGDKLVFDGDLPFQNGKNGSRDLPFVRQVSIPQAGSFWGASIVERIIPIQRSFNAVKNRKHEFLNRVSMGVLTVEDGSCDVDNLEQEGLCPGKILVYRQGSTPPSFMTNAKVPTDFNVEEEKLLNEFYNVSGISDLMSNTSLLSSNTSGVALQLMIEQDEARITVSAERIRTAIKHIGEHVLRLFKQFATVPRLAKVVGDNGEVEMFYFNSADITSDEIMFETQNEITETLAQRRSMVFDLLNNGLLLDENGKLSNRMRAKVLELLGFGLWENAHDDSELHIKKAESENREMITKDFEAKVLEIDDHDMHIKTHISFMLGGEYSKVSEKNPKIEEKLLKHIRTHKQMKKMIDLSENKGE